MRRVIQRTIKTIKIISLTITHSEEEVEYTVINNADQLGEPGPPAEEQSVLDQPALDGAASDEAPDTPTDTPGVLDE